MPGGNDQRPICLDAPGESLSRDRPERAGRKTLGVKRVFLCESYHFTHLDDNLSQSEPALLFSRHSRLDRKTECINERKKLGVVSRDEILGQPRNWNWVFHARLWPRERRRQQRRENAPQSRQIGSAGWWETPAHYHVTNL